MASLPPNAVEADIPLLQTVAKIVGESSASANAIREWEARKAAGEDVTIYSVSQKGGNSLLVGPRAAKV